MAQAFALTLTEKEADLVRQVAKQYGITEDEAATRLMQTGLVQRVRSRTGKGPARVYPMKGGTR